MIFPLVLFINAIGIMVLHRWKAIREDKDMKNLMLKERPDIISKKSEGIPDNPKTTQFLIFVCIMCAVSTIGKSHLR
jgi:hypothetical protein